jgi:hypothetical protein
MISFVEKYKEFKIYDDKGRVYPLHIDRSLYMDCENSIQDQDRKTLELSNIKLIEESPEFLDFFSMMNSESDKVLPSLETQVKAKQES